MDRNIKISSQSSNPIPRSNTTNRRQSEDSKFIHQELNDPFGARENPRTNWKQIPRNEKTSKDSKFGELYEERWKLYFVRERGGRCRGGWATFAAEEAVVWDLRATRCGCSERGVTNVIERRRKEEEHDVVGVV